MQAIRELTDTIRELNAEEIMNVAGGTVPPSCTPQAMRNAAVVGAISGAVPAAFFG
jgi:methylmalonyl-CoA mutase cobalamin-binding subunit